MDILTDILIWVGHHFTRDIYFTVTKIQGILWSLADIAIAWYMLKIANVIREQTGKTKITWRYYYLFVSAILTPFLLLTKTSRQFFILEAAIFAIQYSLLIYTVVSERKRALLYIKQMIQK